MSSAGHDGGSLGASVLDVPTDCQELEAGVDRVTVYRRIREPVRVETSPGARAVRHKAGDRPCARLNARLNASSASYPTLWAIAAMVVSVVASRSCATCIRHSLR